MRELLNNQVLDGIQEVLKQELLQASVRRELIKTPSYVRGIGKTTALVEFAKELSKKEESPIGVIVNMDMGKASNKELFDYEHVYGPRCILKGVVKYVVIDENIDKVAIEEIRGVEVITGFSSSN